MRFIFLWLAAMKTFTTQQSLTVETLHTLHSALKSCPSEDTLEEDPPGLRVPLMPHQKHALAWLLWRERERPSGGILGKPQINLILLEELRPFSVLHLDKLPFLYNDPSQDEFSLLRMFHRLN